MNDHEKMTGQIFNKMIEAYKKEALLGRHPHVRLEGHSPATKLYRIRIESEQISEGLEMRPAEFVAFKNLLKQNGIELQ